MKNSLRSNKPILKTVAKLFVSDNDIDKYKALRILRKQIVKYENARIIRYNVYIDTDCVTIEYGSQNDRFSVYELIRIDDINPYIRIDKIKKMLI